MKNIVFYLIIYARAAKIVESLINPSYGATQPIKFVYYILLNINTSPIESPAYNNSHDPPLGRFLGLIYTILVAEMTCCIFKSVTIGVIICITLSKKKKNNKKKKQKQKNTALF